MLSKSELNISYHHFPAILEFGNEVLSNVVDCSDQPPSTLTPSRLQNVDWSHPQLITIRFCLHPLVFYPEASGTVCRQAETHKSSKPSASVRDDLVRLKGVKFVLSALTPHIDKHTKPSECQVVRKPYSIGQNGVRKSVPFSQCIRPSETHKQWSVPLLEHWSVARLNPNTIECSLWSLCCFCEWPQATVIYLCDHPLNLFQSELSPLHRSACVHATFFHSCSANWTSFPKAYWLFWPLFTHDALF